jgi:hypothetical protein
MRHIWFGALSALVLFIGCKSKSDAAGTAPAPSASVAKKTGPLEPKWVGKRFSLEGERARGNFVVPSTPEDAQVLTVRSYLYDFPPGTKATFGGKSETVKDGKPLVQSADFASKVAKLTLDDVQRKRVDLSIPLMISYPGRGELKLETPPLRIAHAVAHELTRAEKEPVKFPGETADAGAPDTVAVIRVRSRSRRMRILGTGKTVADIDWVALERTHGEPRSAECPRAGKKPRVVKLTDLEIAVFERLTAKKVESKVFPGKPQCTAPAPGQPAPKSQRDEIDEWLSTRLNLPKPPPPAPGAASAAPPASAGGPLEPIPKPGAITRTPGVAAPPAPAAPKPPAAPPAAPKPPVAP